MTQIDLEKAVTEQLAKVIDPETGVDVVQMKLVQDISIDSDGKVTYIFRPSSILCPIAVPLALNIIKAISEVPGITGQAVTVKDYIQAEELNQILKLVLEDAE